MVFYSQLIQLSYLNSFQCTWAAPVSHREVPTYVQYYIFTYTQTHAVSIIENPNNHIFLYDFV